MTADNREITVLLKEWSDGDDQAFEALAPLVYDELKKLARSAFRRERGGHTLQATAVVHEAYLQLVNASVDWDGRAHFYALAARMMRRILLNHANARAAEKRTAEILELHYFAGMTYEEAGNVLGVSQATAKRSLRFGKAWIRDHLEQDT